MLNEKGVFPFKPYIGDIVRLRNWNDWKDMQMELCQHAFFGNYPCPILSRECYERMCLFTGVITDLTRFKHENIVTVMWDNDLSCSGTVSKWYLPLFVLKYIGGNE